MLCPIKMKCRRRGKQLELHFRAAATWGGLRKGAGRKAAPPNVGLQKHRRRDPVDVRNPAHITMRAVRGVPRLRGEVLARMIIGEIRRASAKGFRVLHFSVQNDHLHLIVEAESGLALSRGMQRLASRVAMGVNALVKRRGSLWRERYHRRDLASPRQFRNALVYVTFNIRKHGSPPEHSLDLLSSAIWLDDWKERDVLEKVRAARAGPSPVVEPRTWYARAGWKLLGALDSRESPASSS